MPKLNRVLLGCDPEIFAVDPETNKVVSAHTFCPGTKLEPYKVERGAIQVDGTALEFNIDPASSALEFVTNIEHVMSQLKDHSKGHEFLLDPAVTFEPTYFNSLPDNVRELGCNPDFNAYTGQVNPAPDGFSTTLRTASGHVHIGWEKNVNPLDPYHFEDCQTVIKQLDYYLGLYSLEWDGDNQRRQLYGKAGAFRPKPYGAEYRVLSNVWLRSGSVQQWIFTAVQQAMNQLFSGAKPMYDRFGDFAKDCINENKTDWRKTSKGDQVYHEIGMSLPNIKECLNYGQTKAKPILKSKQEMSFDEAKRLLSDMPLWGKRKVKAKVVDPNYYFTESEPVEF